MGTGDSQKEASGYPRGSGKDSKAPKQEYTIISRYGP